MNSTNRISYISRLSENCFEQLCIRSNLTCTPPRHDENGWDAFVELPYSTPLSIHRDGEPPPIKCLVQVKATDKSLKAQIPMTVSNWEKLAKTSLPSFLAIFYFCDTDDPQSVYLCHFSSSRIFKTLKRVRELEGQKEILRLHNYTMMFSPEDGEKIDLSQPQSLRRAITASSGLDANAYAERKAIILRQVGFENHSYTLRFSAKIPPSDLSDVFLGLRDIAVNDVSVGSRRFGIELLDHQFDEGILRIEPKPVGECKLVVISKDRKTRIALDADIFVPVIPNLPRDLRKSIISRNSINIEFTEHSGKFSANIPFDVSRDFHDLLKEASFLMTLQKRGSKLSILLPDADMPLHFRSPLPEISYFTQVYIRATLIESVLRIAHFRESFDLFVNNLFDQDSSLRWFRCIVQTSVIRLETSDLPNNLFIQSTRGYFATVVWAEFSTKNLLLFCIWKCRFEKQEGSIKIDLSRCMIFEYLWCEEPEKHINLKWKSFEQFCSGKAGLLPMLMYGPPRKLDEKELFAKLHIGRSD